MSFRKFQIDPSPERQATCTRLSFDWGAAEILPAEPYSVSYHLSSHTVGLTLERQSGIHAFASDRRQPFDAWTNTLAFTPCGMEVFSESRQGGEYLLLHVEPSLFASILEDCRSGVEVPAQRITRQAHEPAGRLARRIRRGFVARANAFELEPLLLDLVAIAAEMLTDSILRSRLYRGYGAAGGADRQRIAEAMDFIETHLAEPLSLSRLAELVGLTPLRLLRAFRMHLGITPHAHLRDRRVAHARRLLARTKLPIAEVALDCGFSSQAHLSSTIRQLLGCTPSALRSK